MNIYIAIPESPTPIETSAASELSEHLAQITGTRPTVAPESSAPASGNGTRVFFVGATAAASRAMERRAIDSWRPDEVLVAAEPEGIVLAGDAARGPFYAVDEYLERFVGVRWWTPSASFVPSMPAADLPTCEYRHAPPLKYREAYYLAGFDPLLKVRSKVNFSSVARYEPATKDHPLIPAELGGNYRLHFFEGRRSAYHSFFEILPPSRHFEAHPEWYSLVGGKREPKQLCLSNGEMAGAFIAETLRRLRDDPTANFIQVSQNDWQGACECDACRAAAEEEGAQSGAYLRFVNKVAEAVEGEFPSVIVDTFAYQFTRSAPRFAKPRRNVMVRLCDIECAFNRPLGEFEVNMAFLKDLRDWSRVAPGQIFIWDYLADFRSYMLPHPNLLSIATNIRTFVEAGAVGVFEQGDAGCAAGEFAPLRFWLVSHLLWNPAADEKALVREFAEGYYGRAAAPFVLDYIRLVNGAGAASETPMRCYHENVTDWLSTAQIEEASRLMESARRAAEGEGREFERRVRREQLSIDHAVILNWRNRYGDRGPFVKRWIDDCRAFGVVAAAETVDPGQFEDYASRL